MTELLDRPASAMASPIGLQLGASRWIYRGKPFPHIVAYDVFRPDVYASLETTFRDVLEETKGRPYMDAHGIHGRTIESDIAARFAPLISRSWHDLLAATLGIEATGHVAVGLHHHRVGSKQGFPHNDLNPGWFAGTPRPDELLLAGREVEYTTGVRRYQSDVPVVETVRAASMLYYLANPPWQRGDGGCTGLYNSGRDDITKPVASAPPLNNSLLLFECTPSSFHGFISNRRLARNSIVMWLHQSKSSVRTTWGEDAIVPYGRVSQ